MTLAEQVAKWRRENELVDEPACGSVMKKGACEAVWEKANEEGIYRDPLFPGTSRMMCFKCKHGPNGEGRSNEAKKSKD